ncbi:MAG: hypothetical protein DRJ42_29170, partial [Deltaproteobacteria bacterium]
AAGAVVVRSVGRVVAVGAVGPRAAPPRVGVGAYRPTAAGAVVVRSVGRVVVVGRVVAAA